MRRRESADARRGSGERSPGVLGAGLGVFGAGIVVDLGAEVEGVLGVGHAFGAGDEVGVFLPEVGREELGGAAFEGFACGDGVGGSLVGGADVLAGDGDDHVEGVVGVLLIAFVLRELELGAGVVEHDLVDGGLAFGGAGAADLREVFVEVEDEALDEELGLHALVDEEVDEACAEVFGAVVPEEMVDGTIGVEGDGGALAGEAESDGEAEERGFLAVGVLGLAGKSGDEGDESVDGVEGVHVCRLDRGGGPCGESHRSAGWDRLGNLGEWGEALGDNRVGTWIGARGLRGGVPSPRWGELGGGEGEREFGGELGSDRRMVVGCIPLPRWGSLW